MKVTILSAIYNSLNLLQFNHSLISNFLNGVDFDWVVVDNANEKPDGRFIHIKGVNRPNIPEYRGITSSSYQHGMAINKGLEFINSQKIDSDFLLIIDPDFFIVRDQVSVLDYIIDNNLSFFGTDYVDYDKRPRSVRGFPVAYCMYINRKLVDITKLDFIPERRKDNNLNDVGHKVSESFFNSGHKFEVIDNVSLKEMSKILNVAVHHHHVYTKNMEIYTWNNNNFGLHIHCRQVKFNPSLVNSLIL